MSELYFRLGPMEGFTAGQMADKKEGYANPIRELLQNSLDASRQADNDKCKIDVYIEEIPLHKIPQIHMDKYAEVLESAVETAKSNGSFNATSQRRVELIKETLQQQNVKVLMFADNGIGMSEDGLEAILTGYSRKGADEEKATGSFGIGHWSSYSLSSLRYVLYATKPKESGNKQTLFTGQPILAGHNDGKQRGSAGRIVESVPDEEENPIFRYPTEVPDFIARKISQIDNGTVVVVLGLSEDWGEDAEYAIVSNFFHAIAHDALSIVVHQNGQSKEISTDEVERLITKKKSNQRAMGGSILSGKSVHQAWTAVSQHDFHKICLDNSDTVYVCIQSDVNAIPTIILVRNGMVVARHDHMLSDHMNDLRKNPDYMPFTAVIDVDQESAPDLFELVKGAETPYHDKLQKRILSSEDEARLKELFAELSEKIKAHLSGISRESFNPPLFVEPGKEKGEPIAGTGPRSQTKRARKKAKSKKTRPKKRVRREPKDRPAPKVVSRDLEAKVAVRYTDAGAEWQIVLRVTPESIDARDKAYLSFCLGEDNDMDQAQSYLSILTAEMDSQSISVPKNAVQVELGYLKQGQPYNITATVEKPENIGGLKVALLPLLGLKRNPHANAA